MSIIVNQQGLDDLCARIDKAKRFCLDMEFIPEKTYSTELCLIQVALDDLVTIIDPLAVPNLKPLWERIANPEILVVLHAADQDLDLVYANSGLVPQNIVDTQLAAGFAGFGYPVGYAKLLQTLLQVSISKTESYTDWMVRPLTKEQVEYALDDVRHLLPLWDRVEANLKKLNRLPWALEECQRYTEQEYYIKDRSRAFMRVKGASSLPRRGLSVLQQLYWWRDGEAAKNNKPVRTIISDNILLELSKRPPQRIEDMQRLRSLRPDQIRHYGNDILQAVKVGLEVSMDDCPSWPHSSAPTKRDVLQGDQLYAVLKVICYDLDLAPELVATRDEIQLLIRIHRGEKDDNGTLPLLIGWRKEIAGQKLLDILSGAKVSWKMGNSQHPIELQIDNN
ncbi:MAG: ribonuclease D [Candidatus Obscuribacterales bacterium]|nr:ribonuclease D [Candidatus Obscuribacterales bacterium]